MSGQTLCKRVDARFGHRIVEQILVTQNACPRTGIHDRAGAIHLRDCRLPNGKIPV